MVSGRARLVAERDGRAVRFSALGIYAGQRSGTLAPQLRNTKVVGIEGPGHFVMLEAELSSRSDQGDSLSTAIAQIYIGLGNKDQAFEWLHKAIMQRDGNLFLRVDPIYDPLRNDPRFGNLLRSISLK